MRLRRRALLGAALGTTAFGLAGRSLAFRHRGGGAERPVAVAARSVSGLLPSEPARDRFGALRFRSGLVLTCEDKAFGGFSALWRSADGRELLSVSDNAQWLAARVVERDGCLVGLSEARMAPLLGEQGEPLGEGPAYDTESLAIADGTAFVGIERVHDVRRFAIGRDGLAARGERIPVPPDVRTLPSNASLEALAIAPPGHALAGSLVAIAEEARPGDEAPTKGWVLTGPRTFAFDVARSDGFDVTDLAFLPSGEALLLERRWTIWSGVACRIRRLPPDAFRPGALVDGPVIFEADRSYEIDNMEGIVVHWDGATGETIVTLVSDDNFMPFQRTLLLDFVLT